MSDPTLALFGGVLVGWLLGHGPAPLARRILRWRGRRIDRFHGPDSYDGPMTPGHERGHPLNCPGCNLWHEGRPVTFGLRVRRAGVRVLLALGGDS